MAHPLNADTARRVRPPSATAPSRLSPPESRSFPSDLDEVLTPSSAAEPGPFQEIPGWIWRAFLSAWATLFGLFLIFFTTNPSATFMVIIAALFAVMAFGLPLTLAAQSRRAGYKCKTVIHTHTGTLSVAAAAAQIVLIPIGAVIGLITFILLVL